MAPYAPALKGIPAARAGEIERMRLWGDEQHDLIGRDVLELRRRVGTAFDLVRKVADHPFVSAAVVVGGVFVVAWVARALVRSAPRRLRAGTGWRGR